MRSLPPALGFILIFELNKHDSKWAQGELPINTQNNRVRQTGIWVHSERLPQFDIYAIWLLALLEIQWHSKIQTFGFLERISFLFLRTLPGVRNAHSFFRRLVGPLRRLRATTSPASCDLSPDGRETVLEAQCGCRWACDQVEFGTPGCSG